MSAPYSTGPGKDRGRHGVVDDQRHAVLVGQRRQRFDVDDITGRIANRLTINRRRLVVDQRRQATS